MKILVISKEGDSSGLWYLMQKEGSEVSAYIKEPWARRIMSGIVPHVETIEEGLKGKPDFILFDLNGMGELADSLRKDGHKVVNGSALADKLEFDRAYGINVAKQYGIRIPETIEFKSISEAINFIKKSKEAYAIKLDDNVSEMSSYVAKDKEDMLDYLSYNKEEGLIKEGQEFVLQKVVKGAEISTEVWFSGGLPIWPANGTAEDKKWLAGGLGQRTGCESSLVFHYQSDRSWIVEQTIRKIFPLLKHAKWTGCIDSNCIISEEDHAPYFLEWTPRLGYSAIYAFTATLGISISEFFYRVASETFTIPFKSMWGSSLKLSIPPYPTIIEDTKAAKEVYGLTEGLRINGKYSDDFVPIDVQKGKRSEIIAAGTTGIIGECLGRGKTLIEAWNESKKVFDSVEVPNKGGRYTDGSEKPLENIKKLRKFGYTDVPNPLENVLAGSGKSDYTPYSATRPR